MDSVRLGRGVCIFRLPIHNQKVADFLKIGHTNGKQFAKRLQLFGITEEQLRAALEAVLENEDKHE